jgi:hypothetical protein
MSSAGAVRLPATLTISSADRMPASARRPPEAARDLEQLLDRFARQLGLR